MPRKRLRMILLCSVIAVLIYACLNASMTQKKVDSDRSGSCCRDAGRSFHSGIRQ